jgi:hypothetical protein
MSASPPSSGGACSITPFCMSFSPVALMMNR